jgi:hypothetical protein
MEHQLYGELVSWYRLIDPPDDHRAEGDVFCVAFERALGTSVHAEQTALGTGETAPSAGASAPAASGVASTTASVARPTLL